MPVERNLPSLATLADPAPGGPDSFSELKLCQLNPLAEWEQLPAATHSDLALPESFAELESIAINRLGADLPPTSGWTAGDGRPCTFAELALAGMSDLAPADDPTGKPPSVPATLEEMWLIAEPFHRSSPDPGSSAAATPVSPVLSADGSRTFVEGLELTVLPEDTGLSATRPTAAAAQLASAGVGTAAPAAPRPGRAAGRSPPRTPRPGHGGAKDPPRPFPAGRSALAPAPLR
mmetsp:Transcript_24207/g.61568  ORF Transcript_24207/g.61568 Transcript_24207/m.61568 type:complete len:234 (+) Transcript_24207:196-897(+)